MAWGARMPCPCFAVGRTWGSRLVGRMGSKGMKLGYDCRIICHTGKQNGDNSNGNMAMTAILVSGFRGFMAVFLVGCYSARNCSVHPGTGAVCYRPTYLLFDLRFGFETPGPGSSLSEVLGS